ncbi:MAG: protein phosphatase 2C domain-containing protein [Anaerolineae bacterium]|nr:protein phosphatase 2C domain-containing protein [Anaerolineae bacterium]
MPANDDSQHFVRVRQDIETPLTTLRTEPGMALYLYARSGDSVSAGTVGQDYVAFQHNRTNLTFAVCDGVGQSFMGDLAARIVGDGLNDWLWALDRPTDEQDFAQQVTEALNELTETSAGQVTAYQLPAHLPAIVMQALEMQRRYGSEAMFVAGRIALDGPDPWVALCWLGDAPVAAIDIDGKLVDLGPHGRTSERWNATTGVKGTVHTWVGSARHVARVAGYTDGLSMGHGNVPTDADLERLMKLWATDPPSDDASLFDVRLAPSPATTGQKLLPAPVVPAEQQPGPIEARPIELPDGERTPISGMSPITAEKPANPAESWRPLERQEKQAAPEKPAGEPETGGTLTIELPDLSKLAEGKDLSTREAIRVWQQAAMAGLTSAALAISMTIYLLKEQEKGNKPDSHE